MATMYPVKLSFVLEPRGEPRVKIRIGREEHTVHVTASQRFDFDIVAECQAMLEIELFGKSDSDPQQAVQIKHLSFYGIEDSRFIWLGKYHPVYPEPWATQQKEQGLELPPVLTNTDYLGWNGTWRLQFDVPVFTWIHQVQNLGWIYE
jgi:hypothetical protein